MHRLYIISVSSIITSPLVFFVVIIIVGGGGRGSIIVVLKEVENALNLVLGTLLVK